MVDWLTLSHTQPSRFRTYRERFRSTPHTRHVTASPAQEM
jgi:hypothetical protein